MLIQTKFGKTIEISFEQYLSMSDDDYNELVTENSGSYIENAFFGSQVDKGLFSDDEEVQLDLVDLTSEEKLVDLDLSQEE